MSNVLPIVLWYGGLLGVALAALLVLWGLALYAIKRSTDLFTAGILAASLVLAAASSWAVSHAMSLNQDNQLRKVHEPLVRLVAGSVFARGALEDLRAAAEPSPDLTALQAKYDAHEASIESLLEAEWQYHRGGPWDERGLLYKTTWDLNEVRVHHARWEKRAEALECPATSALPALSDASALLQDRLQMQRTLAQAVGDQFEGYDLIEEQSQPLSDATTIEMLAGVLGGTGVAQCGGGCVRRTESVVAHRRCIGGRRRAGAGESCSMVVARNGSGAGTTAGGSLCKGGNRLPRDGGSQ